ncbi:ISAs1 family transposase [Sansalvadorimonas sp. 2012CJ34-2]|uniref:ISAs1 family transposase n=1 Tax=Parendozoicomonas callyspongiae TaxID=2942213 RepID=A0ABT0PL44_9GAMM|nr:ISAs1 family transposase [Sansalvadorimonas sp. 2012CJ34-2]MCL6272088.1 ISAs1 family transposase [Sansalvadorimonas sp. 2012CJ34-2]
MASTQIKISKISAIKTGRFRRSTHLTAVPELLEAIDLRGALVTADAISCQKSIASKCIEQGADYLLAVKGNQETLQKDIQAVVESHWELHPQNLPSESFAEQENTGHGRKEYRCCWVFDQSDQA